MSKWHPFTFLAFFAFGVVTYVAIARFVSPPETVFVAAGPAEDGWGAGATPNHDPDDFHPVQPPTVEQIATAQPIVTAEPVATVEPVVTAQPVVTAEPIVTAESGATPNHEPRHVGPAPSVTTIPAALSAEPQPAAPAFVGPTFFTVDTTLYARGNAQLRAAPSMTADVVTKLAAGAPLHAIARATDAAWWQVTLAGGQTGYVNRAAVSKTRIAKAKPPAAAPAPVAEAALPQPVPAQSEPSGRSQGTLGYVDEAMNWFSETAARGRPPVVKRAEH